MPALVADRFVCEEVWSPAHHELHGMDLATGDRVSLRFDAARTHVQQAAWADECAAALGEHRIIDFGCLGKASRFVAMARRARAPLAGARPTATSVLEWLEASKPSSSRILYLAHAPEARDIRLRGFVPFNLRLLHDRRLARCLSQLVAGRSVALLADHRARGDLSLAFLRLEQAHARDICAIVTVPPASGNKLTHAAEGHAVYEVTPIADPRAKSLVELAERLVERGRHAAAERTLKAAAAAFDRRGERVHGGETAMRLGRLLLDRGRALEARATFAAAHDRFQAARAPGAAVRACLYAGVAQTDLGLLLEGESACRAAYSGAVALADREQTFICVRALAWNLFWQEQYAESTAFLESAAPAGDAEAVARYWCLVGRLRLVSNDLAGARRAVERARTPGQSPPLVEAIVRTAEAAIQARLGDIEALRVHVQAGIAAARIVHLPLRSLRLRLLLVDGLLEAGRTGCARALGARLKSAGRATLPALLKRRVDDTLDRLMRGGNGSAMARGPSGADSRAVDDIEGLTHLVSLCHDLDDEREAIGRAAGSIRKQTHALGVGIFGKAGREIIQFGIAGSVSQAVAKRSIDLGQPIRPEAASGAVEAATPIRYLGRIIGSVASRWSVEGPGNADRAMACGAAGAAVCAPLVYVLLERCTPPPAGEAAPDLLGVSAGMENVRRAIARAANAPFTVLIEGESGSGKELVARAVHHMGCRRGRGFCALNCAALPEDLIDAELFGHARGAFTGATVERVGLFESASGGTVFLDEVGELSPRAQARLLRVLQEGEIRRVGENFTRPIDARLVAATNRALREEVAAGRFREDLLYRLDVIRIVVPPLRDRVEDIPLLARRFWRQSAERIGSRAVLGQGALAALARYDWPGNVRELQNVLTGLLVSVPSRGVVGAAEMPAAIARVARPTPDESLARARFHFEQRLVRATLARTAGHRGKAASALGLSRQGLAKLMQRLHLDA